MSSRVYVYLLPLSDFESFKTWIPLDGALGKTDSISLERVKKLFHPLSVLGTIFFSYRTLTFINLDIEEKIFPPRNAIKKLRGHKR